MTWKGSNTCNVVVYVNIINLLSSTRNRVLVLKLLRFIKRYLYILRHFIRLVTIANMVSLNIEKNQLQQFGMRDKYQLS